MHGEGWIFDAKFLGGRGDGLKDEVISDNNDPPKICWSESATAGQKQRLGMKVMNRFLNRKLPEDTKITIYLLKEFDENESVTYQYIETLTFQEYTNKYEVNNERTSATHSRSTRKERATDLRSQAEA